MPELPIRCRRRAAGAILLTLAFLSAAGLAACDSGRDGEAGAGSAPGHRSGEATGGGAGVGAGDSDVVAAVGPAPCEAGPSGYPLRVIDDAGRHLRFEAPPGRILSLVPSVTRIFVSLDTKKLLVGRTEFDTLPPVDTLPSVGGGLHPSLERIVALSPDLVVGFAGSSDRATQDRLDELGVRRLEVRPDGVDDVRRIVGLLGCIVKAPERADSLVAAMDSTLSAVSARVAPFPSPRVAFVVGGSPPWVAGPGSYVDQLLRVAGAINVFDDLGRLYGPVSPEAFIARDIDLVLVVPGVELDLPSGVPVQEVPSDVQTPGPDLGRSAAELARILHPEAFR